MIEEHRVSWIQLLPAQLGELAGQVTAAAGRYDPGSLRCAYVAGDKAPLATLERFREALGFEATEYCGMAECGTYATNPPFGPGRPGSIGLPVPGTEVRIDGAARPGHVGEILLRSSAMMQGYWRDPEATAQALRGGWLHTGDLGRIDEDCYIWHAGRSKFTIVRAGSNISPLEVEEALNVHPGIRQSAVIGIGDEKLGQRVVAYAVTRQGQGPPPRARSCGASWPSAWCPTQCPRASSCCRACQPLAWGRSTGPRCSDARSRMSGRRGDLAESVEPGRPGACAGKRRVTGWKWQSVPEPALGSFSPLGQAWDLSWATSRHLLIFRYADLRV